MRGSISPSFRTAVGDPAAHCVQSVVYATLTSKTCDPAWPCCAYSQARPLGVCSSLPAYHIGLAAKRVGNFKWRSHPSHGPRGPTSTHPVTLSVALSLALLAPRLRTRTRSDLHRLLQVERSSNMLPRCLRHLRLRSMLPPPLPIHLTRVAIAIN